MDCVTCGFQSDLTWKGCDSLLSFANRGGGGGGYKPKFTLLAVVWCVASASGVESEAVNITCGHSLFFKY